MNTTCRLLGAGAISLLMLTFGATAAPDHQDGRVFGGDHPFTLDELPPGRVKSRIESLPPAAQQAAMEWLNKFSFNEADLDYLRVDDQGAVFYEDIYLPGPIDQEELDSAPSTELQTQNINQTDVFSLHSRPGASNKVIVDFDGHVITGTAWNGSGPASSYNALPYDSDGNPGAFSQNELSEMAEIWHRIAEDFAPYEIDVTTEEPENLNSHTGRILITASQDANGKNMPSSTAGGVAYVNVWGRSDYHTKYSPALVYYDNLGPSYPPYVAEAASHELGHNLGLSHDGSTTSSYYSGHGEGYVSWGAIMGVGYYTHVTQWSKGEYDGATQLQDDLAIMDGHLSYRTDDHGNTRNTATELVVNTAGELFVSDPETDPFNIYTANKGIIELRTDVDYFHFNTAGGQVDLMIQPAWQAFYNDYRRGANLDVLARLYDTNGQLLAEDDPLDETNASLSASLPAGDYYLAISGVGNPVSPYTDYGSLGQYFISGTLTPGTPTEPPVAVDDSASGDEDNALQIPVLDNDSDSDGGTLSVSAVVAGSHGSTSSDGTLVTYTPGLNFNGSDSFIYYLSDDQGGSAQATVTVTINPVNDNPQASNDSAVTNPGVMVSIPVLDNDSDVDGDSLTLSGINPGVGNVVINGTNIDYTPADNWTGEDSFSYAISDGNGGSASASVTVTVEEIVIAPGVPSNVTAVDNTDGTVTISWQAGAGGNADSYEVLRESPHKKRVDVWINATVISTTSNTLTDNSGSGTFRYSIRAINNAGSSGWSAPVIVEVTGGSGGGGGNGGNNGGGKGRNK